MINRQGRKSCSISAIIILMITNQIRKEVANMTNICVISSLKKQYRISAM
ncbi:hypothetical protein DDI_1987 [Dickeya dianthicola RNS04.9]|nr:hypothetical protein DDI_1987 [Dickeya dianthicola RNS04.9]